jgi:porphyrinogen peroxidase
VTGNLFFVPSLTFLEGVTPEGPAQTSIVEIADSTSTGAAADDGSLGIGSLKGMARHE